MAGSCWSTILLSISEAPSDHSDTRRKRRGAAARAAAAEELRRFQAEARAWVCFHLFLLHHFTLLEVAKAARAQLSVVASGSTAARLLLPPRCRGQFARCR